MKVIYIAGPFRANSSWKMELNIRRSEEAALELWRMGAAPISPHLNTRFFQGELPDDVWLKGDLEIVSRCDALLVLPRFSKSKGTLGEIRHAQKLGLRVFYSLRDVKRWIDRNPSWPQ